MPMQAHEIEALLRETFPDATIQVGGDDGVHMSALVIDESFRADLIVNEAVLVELKSVEVLQD